MADQQPRGRGRARGRARGPSGEGGQQQQPRPGPPQQRGGGQQRPPGMGYPSQAPVQPPPAWGPPRQVAQHQQIRAPAPPPTVMPGGRASHRGAPDAPGSVSTDTSSDPNGGGNGGGNGGLRRGTVRGKRQLHEGILRTRPDSCPTKLGTFGTTVRLSSNYFKLLQQTNWCLYQYRVDIAPDEDRTLVKKALFRRAAREVLPGYIFDGTVMYTSNKLNPDPMELYVQDDRTETNFRFTIRLVADVAAGDYQYIQFFNIIMRKCLGHLKLQLVGRNFFDALAKISVPEHRMELWPGYITSIRQHENAIMMCVEITHKVMRHDTVLQLLSECVQEDRANYKRVFQSRIIGSVVLTEYNNRTYHIDDVDFDSTPSSTFSKRDGSSIAYSQYFKDKYNLRITSLDQPMLVSRAKAREIRAGMAETVYLVPELCRMTGLTDVQRANFQLMRALADHTRMAAKPRVEKLIKFSQRLRQHKDIVQELKDWDMELANNLIEFAGRVLPPETVVGGGGSKYSAGKDVDWTKELRSRPMLHMVQVNVWAIICPTRLRAGAQSFVQVLLRAAKGMQWILPYPKVQEIRDDRPATYLEGLEACINANNPQIIMCVASNNKADRYAAIKKKCYVDRAVPTQVILGKNLESKGVMSIATKVAIQMNCKLGGAPWSVPLPYRQMMVVGYDVCHDTNHKERSYGALVATLNSDCARYFSTVTAHTNGEELSNDFALNIIKACKKYQQVNGALPEKIMVYRDGVGDGQLAYVFFHEVKNIKDRLVELYGSEDLVKMCFIVVSKRINTRIFTSDAQNPAPGTVVDDVITLPERYDFFIVSQCVRQGTVSPTSYNVLFDTMGQSADKIQRVTYKLTHMYFNWSGAVRVPAPCQYAHKLAFLVAQSLHRNPNSELENVLYFL